MKTDRYVTILFLALFFVLQLIYLIRYLNRINRDLANFLIYLQENDTTLAYSKKRIERSFGDVAIDLDKIIQKIHFASIEKMQHQHYINAIVEQVNVGLIACNREGRIDIINQTAKKIFGVNKNQNISFLIDQFPVLLEVFNKNKGSKSTLIEIVRQGKTLQLAVKTTILRFDDEEVFLVSFDDIRSELEAQEIEAWRKLIRILRHEIMNSITPILTLTTAIRRGFISDGKVKPLESISVGNVNDAVESAAVIEERGKAMITFVEKFKNLTTPPALKISLFSIENCFRKIEVLFAKEFIANSIEFKVQITPPDLMLCADEGLVEQVLINLVKNSLEAFSGLPGTISLSVKLKENSKIILQVVDNGCGIPSEYLDSIFVPSFTTKENGTGIGLSLSKQIMQLHQGDISVESREGFTCFELVF